MKKASSIVLYTCTSLGQPAAAHVTSFIIPNSLTCDGCFAAAGPSACLRSRTDHCASKLGQHWHDCDGPVLANLCIVTLILTAVPRSCLSHSSLHCSEILHTALHAASEHVPIALHRQPPTTSCCHTQEWAAPGIQQCSKGPIHGSWNRLRRVQSMVLHAPNNHVSATA